MLRTLLVHNNPSYHFNFVLDLATLKTAKTLLTITRYTAVSIPLKIMLASVEDISSRYPPSINACAVITSDQDCSLSNIFSIILLILLFLCISFDLVIHRLCVELRGVHYKAMLRLVHVLYCNR